MCSIFTVFWSTKAKMPNELNSLIFSTRIFSFHVLLCQNSWRLESVAFLPCVSKLKNDTSSQPVLSTTAFYARSLNWVEYQHGRYTQKKVAIKSDLVRSGIRTHASIRRPERPPPLCDGKVNNRRVRPLGHPDNCPAR